jgi:hypothetical protein
MSARQRHVGRRSRWTIVDGVLVGRETRRRCSRRTSNSSTMFSPDESHSWSQRERRSRRRRSRQLENVILLISNRRLWSSGRVWESRRGLSDAQSTFVGLLSNWLVVEFRQRRYRAERSSGRTYSGQVVGAPPARPFPSSFPSTSRRPIVLSSVVASLSTLLFGSRCVTCHTCQQSAHNHGCGCFAGECGSCKEQCGSIIVSI